MGAVEGAEGRQSLVDLKPEDQPHDGSLDGSEVMGDGTLVADSAAGPGMLQGQPESVLSGKHKQEPSIQDDERRAAEGADRIEADRVLVEHLRARGFTGPSYQQFEAALVDYALPVLKGWMRTGEIFRKCREYGRPVRADETLARWERDEQEELAALTVAHALKQFRDRALIAEGWRPTGGASITTYFVGACVLQFPNQFHSLMSEKRRWEAGVSSASADDPTGQPPFDDPSHLAALRDEVDQMLGLLPPELRKAAEMIRDGYTHAEAAKALGITPGALSERFRRIRPRARATVRRPA
ncbi:RNA polymerase sigma factor [Streptomyces endophyticus]|uniref:RNA polymerase sigma factor 70 region 4 type 2 domain-containing protein n=1 Tax=Streptomyces endophyticus TaxID=714166 RepID=A0ABU6FF64_9ACTN|nr:sigma factor-like helix-turn-helix DNA-binding protein [Streptomyces endophyticus]MEB8342588.1 hypothetical protein [Streptomyces endophyticus]